MPELLCAVGWLKDEFAQGSRCELEKLLHTALLEPLFDRLISDYNASTLILHQSMKGRRVFITIAVCKNVFLHHPANIVSRPENTLFTFEVAGDRQGRRGQPVLAIPHKLFPLQNPDSIAGCMAVFVTDPGILEANLCIKRK